jgi:hypothetical protein
MSDQRRAREDCFDSMKRVALGVTLCSAALLSGCAITQAVKPVEQLATNEICVIDNPAVRMNVLDSYKRILTERGYVVTVLPASTSTVAPCPVTSTYKANWRWDLAVYMVFAEIRIYRDGQLAGIATYDALRGGLNLGKFIKADAKLEELVDQLLPRTRMAARETVRPPSGSASMSEASSQVTADTKPLAIPVKLSPSEPSPAANPTAPGMPSSTHATKAPELAVRTGQDAFSVERLAKEQACHPSPVAAMTGKGPGVETYSVTCSNGDVASFRCEFGVCRALK